MAITATIPTMIFPKREDYLDPDEWVTQAETAYDVLSGAFTTNANLFAEQANALETNVNAKELNATSAATSAANQVTLATTQANNASNSASTATTKANEASASATSASTSASQALTSRNQAETFAQQAQDSALSVDANNIVHKTGNEIIDDVKTFSSSPIVPTPTANTQAANKTYVDTQITGLGTAATKNVGTANGNVMEVGAFGVGAPILIGPTDFNTLLQSGVYKITQHSDWNLSLNRPTQEANIMCIIIVSNPNNTILPGMCQQVFTENGQAFFRTALWSGFFTPWFQIHHTGNILQTTGTSTTYPMSQKAVTDAMITEKVYSLTGTQINPANGTIQYKTVSANTTFTETLTAGQSVILRLISANSYTITFPTITWVGVTAPILTANCAIVLWKEQSTLYGAFVGSLV